MVRIKKSPIFYKYLASYIVVLLIPSLLLGIYGYNQMVKVINHEVTVNNQERLEQLKDNIDVKLIQMNKIAGQIAINPDLTPYALSKNFYYAYVAKSLLNYKMANEFLQEVLLYIRGGDYLYSSVSTYKVPLFINDIYQYKNWSEDEFYQDINLLTTAEFRPAEDVRQLNNVTSKLVTYLVPIPINSQSPYGTVMYMIPKSSLLNVDNTSRSGNTIILDEHNRIITSLRDEAYLHQSNFYQTVTKSGDHSSKIMTFNESRYFVSSIQSKLTNWTYVTLLPVDDVLQPVHEVRNKWLQSLFVILLIGSAFIYAVMHFNYNPIKQLGQWAEKRWGINATMLNELEIVRTIIENMGQSNQELGQKLLSNKSAVKNHSLLSVIKGEFASRTEFNEWGKDVGLTFIHSSFFVILFELGKQQEPDIIQKLIEAVEESLDEYTQGYRISSLEGNRIIFILTTRLESNELEGWLKGVHHTLHDKHKIPITMGVGNRVHNINQVGRSYIEASTAVDFKLIKGNNKMIFFNEVMAVESSGMSYPTQALEQLELLIKQGNSEQITEILIDISANIRKNSTTLFMARCLCFDIINTVMKAMVEINTVSPEAKHHFPDVLSLMQFDTVEELAEVITEACVGLCEVIRRSKEGESEPLITGLTAYMENDYKNPEFSVQSMAEHFSISLSYLSRYFKQQTKRNISDYLNQLRIDHAREMLKSEEVSLKEIVQQIGYYDVSSFIRKFKKSVGVTPGEYRKLYKKK